MANYYSQLFCRVLFVAHLQAMFASAETCDYGGTRTPCGKLGHSFKLIIALDKCEYN